MPLSGVLFVALVLASIFVSPSMPGDKASAARIIDFYTKHQTSQRVSGLLTVIAVVVGVFFFGVLRHRLRQPEGNEQFASMAFGGAILFGAGGCLSAGIQWTLADVPNRLSAGAAQSLNLIQNNLTFALTTAGISALTLTTAIALLRSRMLPGWIGWFSVLIGVDALLGPLGMISFIAMGPWVLVLSVALYRSAPTTVTLPDLPRQSVTADQTSLSPTA
jgi:hypothetical protein